MPLTPEQAAELRAGSHFKIERDPEDDRFMLVTIRRPAASSVETGHTYEGDQVAAKFAKFCVASLEGMGIGAIHLAEDGRHYMVADVSAVLELEKLTCTDADDPSASDAPDGSDRTPQA